MNEKDRYALYEKLYFHEIDSRERLNARLQTPLALIVSFIGALAFMLQNCAAKEISLLFILFWGFWGLCGLALLASVYFFVRSWYNNTYHFIPSAKNTEDYYKELLKTYESYDNGDKLVAQHFRDYLGRYFINCSSANTECNDRRSVYAHKTNTALIVTGVLALASFGAFQSEKLSQERPVTEIKIVAPVEIKGDQMNTKPPAPSKPAPSTQAPPPSPPPPPPPRLIREGVEVVKPQPPKK